MNIAAAKILLVSSFVALAIGHCQDAASAESWQSVEWSAELVGGGEIRLTLKDTGDTRCPLQAYQIDFRHTVTRGCWKPEGNEASVKWGHPIYRESRYPLSYFTKRTFP